MVTVIDWVGCSSLDKRIKSVQYISRIAFFGVDKNISWLIVGFFWILRCEEDEKERIYIFAYSWTTTLLWGNESALDNQAVRLRYDPSNEWGVGGCCEGNATNTHQKIFRFTQSHRIPSTYKWWKCCAIVYRHRMKSGTWQANLNAWPKLWGRPIIS